MKRTKSALVGVCLGLMAVSSFAAETSVKGTIYSSWMLNSTSGKGNANAFTVDRAYFGAESKLSDYTSMRITFDIRPEKFSTSDTTVTVNVVDTGVDKAGDTIINTIRIPVTIPKRVAYEGYPIILKYAYGDWKIKPVAQYLKVRFGLQPTNYLNYMDATWNRRYVEKLVVDGQGWLSTADLGISAIGTLGPQGSLGEVALSVLNGTKYSDFTDKNNQKDINLAGKLTPFYNSGDFNQVALFGQFYTGTQNKTLSATDNSSDWNKQIISAGGKLAYQKSIDLCFDLNFHNLGQGVGRADLKQSGMSFWGNLYLGALAPSAKALKTLVPFGRVDIVDPNTDLANDGSTLMVVGLECAPVKGVKASFNFRNRTYEAANTTDEKYFYFNTEFKF